MSNTDGITKDLLANLAVSIPGVEGSAVPEKLRMAIDYALQELAKCAKPATRRSPAEPADPIQFIVQKLRAYAQVERDTVSDAELARIKKRRGRRGGRRGSVVCSAPKKNDVPEGWQPKSVPKSDEMRQHLKQMVSKSILLHDANDFTLDTIVDCMFEREFEPDVTIIKEGDPGDNLYLLTKGWIQVYKFLQNETKDSKMKVSAEETEKDPIILTRIPDSDADLRRWYTKGPHSILKNLPHPKINIVRNHSYVSVKQCIADFLGKGYSPEKVKDVNMDRIRRIVDSPIAHQVYNRARNYNKGVDPSDLIVLMGVQWSDDFEPNGSSKSNRGSVWLKTLTFVSDSYSNNELGDTYPVSIGLKSDNHDVIEHKLINDCAHSTNGKVYIIH